MSAAATPWDGVDRRCAHARTYTGPLRRSSDAIRGMGLEESLAYLAQRLDTIDTRLDAGSRRMDTMQSELDANTSVTTEVRELLAAGRSGLRVLGWIGSAGLWIVKAIGIGAASGSAVWALWTAIKTGQPPHQP